MLFRNSWKSRQGADTAERARRRIRARSIDTLRADVSFGEAGGKFSIHTMRKARPARWNRKEQLGVSRQGRRTEESTPRKERPRRRCIRSEQTADWGEGKRGQLVGGGDYIRARSMAVGKKYFCPLCSSGILSRAMCSAVGARAVLERCWVEIHSSGAGVKIQVTCHQRGNPTAHQTLGYRGFYYSIVDRDGASVAIFFPSRTQKQLTYASHLRPLSSIPGGSGSLMRVMSETGPPSTPCPITARLASSWTRIVVAHYRLISGPLECYGVD
jgi:hypothetical protein